MRTILSAIVLIMAATLAACDRAPATSETSNAPSASLDVVKVNYLPYISFAPLVFAQEEGLFEAEGIRVEFITFKRSNQGIPALAGGQLDVLAGSINAGLLNAMARGAHIRLVADKGHIDTKAPPTTALFVRKELAENGTFEDPERLRGLRYAAREDNATAMFFDRAIIRMGADIKTMKPFEMPTSYRWEALANNSLDMATLTEPWLTRMNQAGGAVAIVNDYEIYPDFQFAVLTFGPSFLEKRPDVGRRFMKAYLRGVRLLNEGKTERNLDALEKHTKLDRELLQNAGWIACRADGMINVPSVMEFQEWSLKDGSLDRVLKPEEFWEPRFVEEAWRELQAEEREAKPTP